MATVSAIHPSEELRERRFFLIMACVLAALVVAGFGRAALARLAQPGEPLPLLFHVHALAFFGWVALYVAQNALVYSGRIAAHRQLGLVALILLPVLVILGFALAIVSIRLTGGPPVFSVSEFLFVNVLHIAGFAAPTGAAIAMWRRTDWHRRLMLCAMASLAAPGIARLLPLPYAIPYAFPALFAASMVIPVIGLALDRQRSGRVHPAWLWGIGSVLLALLIGEALGASAWGRGVTIELIAGTPGAERPFEAFFPG